MLGIDGDFGKAHVWFRRVLFYCSAGHNNHSYNIYSLWISLGMVNSEPPLEIVKDRQLSTLTSPDQFCFLLIVKFHWFWRPTHFYPSWPSLIVLTSVVKKISQQKRKRKLGVGSEHWGRINYLLNFIVHNLIITG